MLLDEGTALEKVGFTMEGSASTIFFLIGRGFGFGLGPPWPRFEDVDVEIELTVVLWIVSTGCTLDGALRVPGPKDEMSDIAERSAVKSENEIPTMWLTLSHWRITRAESSSALA